QIIHLEAAGLEYLLDEHIWRRNARPLELAHHGSGRLGDHVRADMNPELLLDEQQPLVGLPLELPARLLRLFIRPVAAGEEVPQIDFAPGVDKLLLTN